MSEKKIYQFTRGNMTIPLEGDFRNAKGIKIRYRYSEGEGTLIAKDQSKDAEKGYLYVGGLTVPVEDPLIQQFLDLMIADGKNIKVYNPVKDAEDANSLIELTIDAMAMAKNAEDSDLLTVAYDVLGKSALQNSPQQVRQLLYAVGSENPKSLIDAFENKENNKNKYFVAEALAQGVLEEGFDGQNVLFADGKEMVAVGKGETAMDAIVEYFNTKEGKVDKTLVAQALANKLKEEADDKKPAPKTTAK